MTTAAHAHGALPQGALRHSALDAAELADLRATVREIATAADGPATARALEHPTGTAYDVATWTTLSQDVGLAGLGLPESAGGIGGLVELLAVAEELGARLLAVPFLSSTVLAGQLLARCGEAGAAALERVCAGEILTVALADRAGRPASGGLATERPSDGAVLDAEAFFVPDAAAAVALVVTVAGPDGLDLALVETGAAGVAVEPMSVLDFTRAQAKVTLTGAPATRLSTGGAGAGILSDALDVAYLALAADQLGGMQRAFDLTLDHVKTRRQFNRSIGSFQAVKHRLADALATVERARTAVERVTWQPLGPAALADAAAVAQVWCSDAYLAVTAETVQLHGGIGFTWEHDAHLYVRRARSDAALWGDATWHRERLAALRGW